MIKKISFTPTGLQLHVIKAVLFLLCLLPAVSLVAGVWQDTLGANPVEALIHSSGEWALRFLLITLMVTPLRRWLGWPWLIRLRRMLGMFAFVYGAGHFLMYIWLDQFFDWQAIMLDVLKRPFITAGMTALLLMLPLALTSNAWSIRRLGGRRWQALHRSIYVIGIFAVVHYWWLVKADVLRPAIYAGILVVLLGLRIWWRELERRRQLTAIPPPPGSFKGKVIRLHPKP